MLPEGHAAIAEVPATGGYLPHRGVTQLGHLSQTQLVRRHRNPGCGSRIHPHLPFQHRRTVAVTGGQPHRVVAGRCVAVYGIGQAGAVPIPKVPAVPHGPRGGIGEAYRLGVATPLAKGEVRRRHRSHGHHRSGGVAASAYVGHGLYQPVVPRLRVGIGHGTVRRYPTVAKVVAARQPLPHRTTAHPERRTQAATVSGHHLRHRGRAHRHRLAHRMVAAIGRQGGHRQADLVGAGRSKPVRRTLLGHYPASVPEVPHAPQFPRTRIREGHRLTGTDHRRSRKGRRGPVHHRHLLFVQVGPTAEGPLTDRIAAHRPVHHRRIRFRAPVPIPEVVAYGHSRRGEVDEPDGIVAAEGHRVGVEEGRHRRRGDGDAAALGVGPAAIGSRLADIDAVAGLCFVHQQRGYAVAADHLPVQRPHEARRLAEGVVRHPYRIPGAVAVLVGAKGRRGQRAHHHGLAVGVAATAVAYRQFHRIARILRPRHQGERRRVPHAVEGFPVEPPVVRQLVSTTTVIDLDQQVGTAGGVVAQGELGAGRRCNVDAAHARSRTRAPRHGDGHRVLPRPRKGMAGRAGSGCGSAIAKIPTDLLVVRLAGNGQTDLIAGAALGSEVNRQFGYRNPEGVHAAARLQLPRLPRVGDREGAQARRGRIEYPLLRNCRPAVGAPGR